MPRIPHLAAAVATIVLSSVAGPPVVAVRDGSWSDAETVVGTHHPTLERSVAAGRGRYAVAVWTRGTAEVEPEAASPAEPRVFASVRRLGRRRFGEPRPISPLGAHGEQLGIAHDGQTVVTWSDALGRPHAVFRTPDGGWGEPQRLSEAPGTTPALGVGADGTAVAAWRQELPTGDDAILAAIRAPRGRFGLPQLVATGGGIGVFGPVVAVSHEGDAAIAWSGECDPFDPDQREPAEASILTSVPFTDPPRYVWGSPERIPGSECPDAGVRIAMDRRGTVAVVINGAVGRSTIRASVRPPGGAFSAAERISNAGHTSDFAELGMTARGKAIVVWQVYTNGARGVWASARPPRGEFTPPRRISARGLNGLHALAVGRSGHAVAVWQSLPSFRLRAAYMPRGGWFGDPETVSRRLPDHALAHHDVAARRRGKAVAVWSVPARDDSERGLFVANRR